MSSFQMRPSEARTFSRVSSRTSKTVCEVSLAMEIKIRNGKLYVDGKDRGEVHSLELRIYHRDTAEEIAERSKKATEPTEKKEDKE